MWETNTIHVTRKQRGYWGRREPAREGWKTREGGEGNLEEQRIYANVAMKPITLYANFIN